jgi:hypothetical protein
MYAYSSSWILGIGFPLAKCYLVKDCTAPYSILSPNLDDTRLADSSFQKELLEEFVECTVLKMFENNNHLIRERYRYPRPIPF